MDHTKHCPACNTDHDATLLFCGRGHVLESQVPGDYLAGRILGDRYRLASVLGQGGFGTVYLAAQLHLGHRPCVVKTARPELAADPEFSARFRRERIALAGLSCANTVQILDHGSTQDGVEFLVMEYVEGPTLRQLLKRESRLRPSRAVRIASGICRSLEEAHEKGILHRDLKPANIMLVDPGQSELVKVIDFGLARFTTSGESSFQTRTGEMPGTPLYSSPEQLVGQASRVGPRGDLYALGATLYEMLTGIPPFGDTVSVELFDHSNLYFLALCRAKTESKPTPPGQLNPPVPLEPALERLLMSLLEKDPDMRPSSATEVRIELGRWLDREGGSGEFGGLGMKIPGPLDDTEAYGRSGTPDSKFATQSERIGTVDPAIGGESRAPQGVRIPWKKLLVSCAAVLLAIVVFVLWRSAQEVPTTDGEAPVADSAPASGPPDAKNLAEGRTALSATAGNTPESGTLANKAISPAGTAEPLAPKESTPAPLAEPVKPKADQRSSDPSSRETFRLGQLVPDRWRVGGYMAARTVWGLVASPGPTSQVIESHGSSSDGDVSREPALVERGRAEPFQPAVSTATSAHSYSVKATQLEQPDAHCRNIEAKSVVQSLRGPIGDCYRKRLKFAPALAGEIQLRWACDQLGQVQGSVVLLDTVEDDVLTECVEKRIKEASFPGPDPSTPGYCSYSWKFEFTPPK